jgi:hypothetical protein
MQETLRIMPRAYENLNPGLKLVHSFSCQVRNKDYVLVYDDNLDKKCEKNKNNPSGNYYETETEATFR